MSTLAEITKSEPCKARCPICRELCFNRDGHLWEATAGRRTIPEIHCCSRHCWGDLSALREMLRCNAKATRLESLEEISRTHRPISARARDWEKSRVNGNGG